MAVNQIGSSDYCYLEDFATLSEQIVELKERLRGVRRPLMAVGGRDVQVSVARLIDESQDALWDAQTGPQLILDIQEILDDPIKVKNPHRTLEIQRITFLGYVSVIAKKVVALRKDLTSTLPKATLGEIENIEAQLEALREDICTKFKNDYYESNDASPWMVVDNKIVRRPEAKA